MSKEAGTPQRHLQSAIGRDGRDPVLESLNQAAASYLDSRAELDILSESLAEARETVGNLEAARTRLKAQVDSTTEQLAQEQQRVAAYRERADQMSTCTKDLHGAVFGGNIYDMILSACITVTGATRGLYLTARGGVENLRVRAAKGVEGYPAAPPSKLIHELCRRAVAERDTVVCNEDDMDSLPPPAREGERFHNCVTAPVVLLKNFDGIVIVADKMSGDFNEDDVDTLLSVGDQAAVAVENVRLQRELQGAYISTVSMLADAVEAKDPSTYGHCEMVSRFARLTAQQLRLREDDTNLVCYGALLHDVGKIGVSDGILNKPGPLLPEERDLVRSHVKVGHALLSRVPALARVAEVVLRHHEWYDGTGYPNGLRGEEIPIAARIVCVVDAYCAMITKRSYKEAYGPERAREELLRCAGTQFDPRVVEAFLAMLDSGQSEDQDDDLDAECGLLPGFGQLVDAQRAVYV